MPNHEGPLWRFFDRLPKQNGSHNRAACKACIAYDLRNPPADSEPADYATELASNTARFQEGTRLIDDSSLD